MAHLLYNDTPTYTITVTLYSMLHISPSDSWPGQKECVQPLVSCVGWLDFSQMISTVFVHARLRPSHLVLFHRLSFHPGLPHQRRMSSRRVAHHSPVVYLRLRRGTSITCKLTSLWYSSEYSLGWKCLTLPAAISMEQRGGEPRLAAKCSGLFPPNVHALTSAFNCKTTREPWVLTNHSMISVMYAQSYTIICVFLFLGFLPIWSLANSHC